MWHGSHKCVIIKIQEFCLDCEYEENLTISYPLLLGIGPISSEIEKLLALGNFKPVSAVVQAGIPFSHKNFNVWLVRVEVCYLVYVMVSLSVCGSDN